MYLFKKITNKHMKLHQALAITLLLLCLGIPSVMADVTCSFINITQGPQGIPGINGTNGIDGYSPVYGIDYINGTNGAQGPQGINGTPGVQGPQGLQGIPGDPGPNNDAWYLWVNGSRAMTGGLKLGGFNISNVLDPVYNQDAATKAYCDALNVSMKAYADSISSNYNASYWTGTNYNSSYITSTYNATYDAKPDSNYNASYWTGTNYNASYITSASNYNASYITSTYNATYDAKPSIVYNASYWTGTNYNASYWTGTNYNASYDGVSNYNASYWTGTNYNASYLTSTYNTTYDAKTNYNASYATISYVGDVNTSMKGYVDALPISNYNASYITSTYNATYHAKPDSTYNATYDAKTNYNASYWTGTNYNSSYWTGTNYNASYDGASNYNASYWTGTNYNASYLTSTYNATYDAKTNYNASYWTGTNYNASYWTGTNYNASYEGASNYNASYVTLTNTSYTLDSELAAYAALANASYFLSDGSRPMLGNLTFAGNWYINSLTDPIQSQDAATKAYVDSEIAGMSNYNASYWTGTNYNSSYLTSTYNATYDAKSNYNASYWTGTNYNASYWTGTNYNASYEGASNYNSSYWTGTNYNASYWTGTNYNSSYLTSASDVAPGLNTEVLFNFNGNESGNASFTYVNSTGIVSAPYFSGDGSGLTNIGATSSTALTFSVKEANIGAISKGQAVYINGGSGGLPTVTVADNTNTAKSRVVGLAATDINKNAAGKVRRGGTLTLVDTQATNTAINPNAETWAAGDLLFATTNGGLTKVRPTSGRSVKVAYSLSGSSATDTLLVYPLENPVWSTAASGEDIVLRMGDSVGVNKVSFRNYTNGEVGWILSNGTSSFGGGSNYNASYLISTYNATYDAKPSIVYNASYITSTYNATYDAKTNYNSSYATTTDLTNTNNSMKAYVDATASNYNASYWTGTNYNASYLTSTYNATYDAKTNYNASYWTGTNYNVTYATQDYVGQTNTSMKGYVDGVNTSMKAYVDATASNYNSSYWTGTNYNASYLTSTFNATYDGKTNYNSSYWTGTNYNASYWTGTNYNASYEGASNYNASYITSTYNATYDAKPSIVYNASYLTSTYNATYDAKTNYNSSYATMTDLTNTNSSMKAYVDATASNYNASYWTGTNYNASYLTSTFNATYDAKTNYNSSYWTGTNYNASYLTSTYNATYDANSNYNASYATLANTSYFLVDGTRAMTGNLSMGSKYINSIITGTLGTDAVNKTYADSKSYNASYLTSTYNATYDSKLSSSVFGYLTLMSGSAMVTTTNPTSMSQWETTTNKNNVISINFTDGGSEVGMWIVDFPADWNASANVIFTPVWTARAGSAGQTVHFDISGKLFPDDAALDTALAAIGDSQDSYITSGDVHVGPATTGAVITSVATGGNTAIIKVTRDSATDNLGGTAELIGLRIKYARILA